MKNIFSVAWLLVFIVGCQTSSAPARPLTAIPVQAAAAHVKDIVSHVETIGLLEAAQAFEVRPQVSGIVEEIYIKEGAWVKKGELLFKLDASQYACQLQQAEAQLAIDMAAFKTASQKVERQRSLAKKELISQMEWESTQAAADSAKAQLKLDEARVALAKLDVENCTIKALQAGRLSKIHTHVGSLVSAAQSQPLVVISLMHPLIVEFAVSEKELPLIDQAREVTLQPLCMQVPELCGKILFVDNAFDPRSGQILVRAEVPNETLCLRPGQSLRVQIVTKYLAEKVVIPQKAIRYDAQGAYVYVVEADEKVELRHLVLGDEHREEVIVEEGLQPGDKVVTAGHLRLFPTAKVEIKS